MSDEANRALVERFFEAADTGDMATLMAIVDEGMVMEWPQSGERFRGRENVFGAMGAVAVKPVIAGQPRLAGGGNTWVFMAPLRYGEDLLHYVAVIEVGQGKIKRGTGYWGAPFEAQEARARFLDREPAEG
jgi:ketosteroid isomerase-like protein